MGVAGKAIQALPGRFFACEGGIGYAGNRSKAEVVKNSAARCGDYLTSPFLPSIEEGLITSHTPY